MHHQLLFCGVWPTAVLPCPPILHHSLRTPVYKHEVKDSLLSEVSHIAKCKDFMAVLFLAAKQQTMENSSRDGNTRTDLICLLRNLYGVQEARVRTGHGTTDWLQIGKGVSQGSISSPCLFNL